MEQIFKMTLLENTKINKDGSIRISVADARLLAADLKRCADESEDHEMMHPLEVHDMAKGKDPLFSIWVTPHEHPHDPREDISKRMSIMEYVFGRL